MKKLIPEYNYILGSIALVMLLSAAFPASAQLSSNTTIRGDGKTLVTFTAGSGTWQAPPGLTSVEVLVVGGGAGSSVWSCGAGSGGAYYTSAYTLSGGSVNIVVGAGGTAGGSNGNSNPGGSSSFDGMLIAYGGTLTNGWGIGGDSGGYSTNGGSTVVPGYLGGRPQDASNSSGAGARNPGAKGNTQHGGDGLQCSITGSATYYGGGGGANCSYADGGGLGGGGGGPPAIWAASLPGVDNLGGGAGGSWGGAGASGGSGVVIIAYVYVPPPIGTFFTFR